MPKGKPGALNNAYKHGHTTGKFSSTYYSWSSMIQRCTNPKRPYWARYGGRGVKVHARWMDFGAFLQDMGERPDGTSLDRFPDKDGDYAPGNCRWATRTEQANNTSANVLVEIDGQRKTLTEWCRALGVSANTVRSRMHKWGYSAHAALTRPKQDRVKAAIAMTQKRMCEFSGKD